MTLLSSPVEDGDRRHAGGGERSRFRVSPADVTLAVTRRWPTALGVAAGADALLSEVTDETTRGYAGTLPILPLLYVAVVLLRRRSATWPVLFACLALVVGLGAQDWVEPTVVIFAVALAATIWGTGHGRHRDHEFRLQVAGMVGFGAIAVAGLLVSPDLARYLVAAGWLAHGAWDYWHLARNRAVARSFAEWCGALDIVVGTTLIIGPML
jgi:hypothetical protein